MGSFFETICPFPGKGRGARGVFLQPVFFPVFFLFSFLTTYSFAGEVGGARGVVLQLAAWRRGQGPQRERCIRIYLCTKRDLLIH